METKLQLFINLKLVLGCWYLGIFNVLLKRPVRGRLQDVLESAYVSLSDIFNVFMHASLQQLQEYSKLSKGDTLTMYDLLGLEA